MKKHSKNIEYIFLKKCVIYILSNIFYYFLKLY